MKFTKFIPIALAAALFVAPAFADPDPAPVNTQSDVLQFTVSPFFSITKNAGKTYTGAVNPNLAYTQLTVTTPITFGYHVITNNRSDKVNLKATALSQAGDDVTNALGGTPAAPIICFTNNNVTGTDLPSAEEVANALAGSTVKANTPNAIAFYVTPTVAKVADTGKTTAAPDPGEALVTVGDLKVIQYKFDNGEYNFDYVISSANNDTFSTYDTEGAYKATVTMSQVTP